MLAEEGAIDGGPKPRRAHLCQELSSCSLLSGAIPLESPRVACHHISTALQRLHLLVVERHLTFDQFAQLLAGGVEDPRIATGDNPQRRLLKQGSQGWDRVFALDDCNRAQIEVVVAALVDPVALLIRCDVCPYDLVELNPANGLQFLFSSEVIADAVVMDGCRLSDRSWPFHQQQHGHACAAAAAEHLAALSL